MTGEILLFDIQDGSHEGKGDAVGQGTGVASR